MTSQQEIKDAFKSALEESSLRRDIDRLSLTMYGDGNGNPGVRTDIRVIKESIAHIEKRLDADTTGALPSVLKFSAFTMLAVGCIVLIFVAGFARNPIGGQVSADGVRISQPAYAPPPKPLARPRSEVPSGQ